MIAAVLPLPPNPEEVQEVDAETASVLDQQQRFDHQFGPVVDKSYQKAHWWRNLNRIMSGVGTLLIGAIVRSLCYTMHDQHLILTFYRLPLPSLHRGCREQHYVTFCHFSHLLALHALTTSALHLLLMLFHDHITPFMFF